MTKVRCIINERIGGAVHTYYPLNVTFQDEGIKKPNKLTASFTMANKVEEGDIISYIQDVTDVDALRAIYNFQLSTLDEGGYDQDPTTDSTADAFTIVSDQKYAGFYALEFDGAGQEVNISTVDAIDLSEQFDIILSVSPDAVQTFDGGDEPIMWSFFDGNHGLEIGMSGSNGDPSSWRAFIRYRAGAALTNTLTGANEQLIRTTDLKQDPVIIRISRNQDNLIQMFVNGEEDASVTATGTMQPSGVDMRFGSNRTGVFDYEGLMHQVRVYCGENLTDSQATLIRQAKPIPFSMRFRGKIWELKDNTVSKLIKAQSNSFELLSGKLDSLTPILLPGSSYDSILQDAIDTLSLLNSFRVTHIDNFSFNNFGLSFVQTGNIIGIGSFLDFADYLFKMSFTTFQITARNVFIVESSIAGKQTNFVFQQKDEELDPNVAAPYVITENDLNDDNLVNEVILTSSGITSVRKVTNPNDIRRTLRRNIQILDAGEDLQNYAERLHEILSGGTAVINPIPKNKFIIKITSLINSVRTNQDVAIKNLRKNIDTNDIITQIMYSYPSEHTKINTGNIDINYYDEVEKTYTTSDGLLDVNVTPPPP